MNISISDKYEYSKNKEIKEIPLETFIRDRLKEQGFSSGELETLRTHVGRLNESLSNLLANLFEKNIISKKELFSIVENFNSSFDVKFPKRK